LAELIPKFAKLFSVLAGKLFRGLGILNVTKMPAGALTVRAKHSTFKVTFWLACLPLHSG
jgi:hypothetical protein